MKKTLALVLALLLVVALVPASVASAEWKPSSTVSIIIPAGAGGDTDLTARVFAQYAKEMTGVDFIVVNASGAAGSIAANQVLSAAPDGLTVLYGHNLVNVANVAGVTDYNYTAFKLGPTFAKNPANQLFVNPEKYDSLEAFIEAAKANPGKLKACTEVGAYTYYLILAFEKAVKTGIGCDDCHVSWILVFRKYRNIFSQRVLHREDVGAKAQLGIVAVGLAETVHDPGRQVVFHHGEKAVVLGRPGVAPEVRFTRLGAAAADFFPDGVPPLADSLQEFDDLLVVGLVIDYEYRFHNQLILDSFAARRALRRSRCSVIPQ